MKFIFGLLLTFIIFTFSTFAIFADTTLADRLQDLAKQTACLGRYSATEAGGYAIDDPHDYYTPDMMAKRFQKMSGERTRIQTFYGVCFDYAQAAWDDIKKYQSWYNEVGMKEQEWYIAAVHDNSHEIILYDPIPEERVQWSNGYYRDSRDGKILEKYNGVYLKRHNTCYVSTHGDATWHAWIWVQHTDGTWYWVDPTWTDTRGYIVWGRVEGDKEVRYPPKKELCVVQPPSSAPRTAQNTTPKSSSMPSTSTRPNYSYSSSFWEFGDGIYFSIGYIGSNVVGDIKNIISSSSDDDDNAESETSDFFGFQLGLEIDSSPMFFMLGVDIRVAADNEENSNYSMSDTTEYLAFIDLGLKVLPFLCPYIGGGLGISPDGFGWEVKGGTQIPLSILSLRAEVSHSPYSGTTTTLAAGFKISD